MFSTAVTEAWLTPLRGEVRTGTDGFGVVVDPGLREDRRVMLLTLPDGVVRAAVSPAVAQRIGLARLDLTSDAFLAALASADVHLHGADHLFFYPDDEADRVRAETADAAVRLMSPEHAADVAAFDAFTGAASEQDLDDAYVELDHWAVMGSFAGDRLVAAASMYPWGATTLADLGVLTLPDFRGQGHARRVVRAISAEAMRRGYETQYRCQLDNVASIALARAAGLVELGTWDVVSPDSPA